MSRGDGVFVKPARDVLPSEPIHHMTDLSIHRLARTGICFMAAFACLGLALAAPLRVAVNDPLYSPLLDVELGPEQMVAPGAGWPYLFQAREGTTVVLGHLHWRPKQPEPVVFTTRSFDGRKTWSEWRPAAGQGAGPVTEGAVVQLKDGRILIFDVYAYHVGEKIFQGKRWISRDGWKTVSAAEPIRVSVPGARTDGMVDDRFHGSISGARWWCCRAAICWRQRMVVSRRIRLPSSICPR